MTLKTFVESVRALALAVAVALTLDGAVGAHIAEITTAVVGRHTCPSHTPFWTHLHTTQNT